MTSKIDVEASSEMVEQPQEPHTSEDGKIAKSFPALPTLKSLDLRVIYPTPTNNFRLSAYKDSPDSYVCNLLSVPLSSTMHILRAMTVSILLITCLAMLVMVSSRHWYHISNFIGFMLVFVALNGLLTHKIYCFLDHSRRKSLDFHEYGSKVYFYLCACMSASVVATFLWTFHLLYFYAVFGLEPASSGMHLHFQILISWSFAVPLGVYSICGLAVLKKLPDYFEQFGYRRYRATQDWQYCLNTHRNDVIPSKLCCFDCAACTCTDCGPGYKCTICAVCVWMCLLSFCCLLGVFLGLAKLFVGFAQDDGSYSINVGFVVFFCACVGLYLHFTSGVYGMQLVLCRAGESVRFHKYFKLTMSRFSCLCGVYGLVFGGWVLQMGVSFVINEELWLDLSSRLALMMLFLVCSVWWVPFEGVVLIDKHAQWYNYSVKMNTRTCVVSEAENGSDTQKETVVAVAVSTVESVSAVDHTEITESVAVEDSDVPAGACSSSD